ncbi:hypothetical protein [Longimicrobium terrae]|uniref:Uncharacterized protein n=1 Tax=Longimicrobium terrae TaxID=1639882 RepID=A0A841H7C9_9BACT|nr:hypothetical protein [Longimicrobium terrae]MBB4639462.1 hypothetical protein [Longimicrobium terrae]MBB6073834.1 hypothetical protein [Longimicrobium terrae]NNC32512.1 hypothetical protein [Longimicrobium terrae]
MPNQRKLRLDFQDLQVESFDPATQPPSRRGTVLGQGGTNTATGGGLAGCDCGTWANTCYGSCPDTCYNTCPGAGGCPAAEETQGATCAETCYWVGTRPFYDGIC